MSPLDADRRVTQQLEPGAQAILLLAPPLDSRSDEVCADLLGADVPESVDVLFVTLARPPDDQFERWQGRAGDEVPAKLGFVGVESSRSGGDGSGPAGPKTSMEWVSSPGDLTGLGIEISDVLTDWADDGNRTVVCFHSLTTLIQYVDVETAFRFFHVLTSRVRTAGALGHFHADPSAHDDGTLNSLKTLFDTVVEWSDDEWIVQSR